MSGGASKWRAVLDEDRGTGYWAVETLAIISYILLIAMVGLFLFGAFKQPRVLTQLPMFVPAFLSVYVFRRVARAAFAVRDYTAEQRYREVKRATTGFDIGTGTDS
jgi:hypothetical protein